MSEQRLPCDCYAAANTDGELVVTAEAFLCEHRHRQGQVVGDAVVIHPGQATIEDAE